MNYIFNSRTDTQGFSHFHNGCICVLIYIYFEFFFSVTKGSNELQYNCFCFDFDNLSCMPYIFVAMKSRQLNTV